MHRPNKKTVKREYASHSTVFLPIRIRIHSKNLAKH